MSTTLTNTLMQGDYPPEEYMRGTLRLRGGRNMPATTAYPELQSKGYTVVKTAITRERAASYVDRMYSWLEGFGMGFKRNDRSTWHIDQLPPFHRGGLFNRYGVGHEQFAWDIRAEPAVQDAFAAIWGTDKLLVSFDGVNISLPLPKEELEGQRSKAWPHVDQSPNRRYKHRVQGIVNLEYNGPDDGGLKVLAGSLPLFNEFFETHAPTSPDGYTWRDAAWYSDSDLQWFYDRGCRWIKVEAEPGDLILWDSRTIHYGAHAEGDRPRIATYVCYKPAADIDPEMMKVKVHAAREYISTSHDPLLFRLTGTKVDGPVMENERTEPLVKPVLTDRMQQLAGTREY